MFFTHFGRLALAGVLGAWALPTHAEPLTLEAAIGRTLASNPALRAEGAGVDALEQQLQLDSLKPAPTIGADLENVAGTGQVSGIRSAEATLRLGQVIELGGKREARRERGLADIAKQENAISRQRLDLAAETTKRFVTVVEGQDELALARSHLDLARETGSAIRYRVERGVAPEADAVLADIAVARAELAQENAEHELESAKFALASLWGAMGPGEIVANGALLNLPDVPEFQALAERLRATPEFAGYELDLARIEADRGVARTAARPDLALSAGVRRLEAFNDQALVFSFSMPFGTAERSAFAVARTEAEVDVVSARRDAALLEARQILFGRYQELRHARIEVESLSQSMLPAAERGLALTRAGYDDARYSVLQLTQAQGTLLQLQQERLAAAARYHATLADIERSTAAAGAHP